MAITCLSTQRAANQPLWRCGEEKKEEDMYSGVWEAKKETSDK